MGGKNILHISSKRERGRRRRRRRTKNSSESQNRKIFTINWIIFILFTIDDCTAVGERRRTRRWRRGYWTLKYLFRQQGIIFFITLSSQTLWVICLWSSGPASRIREQYHRQQTYICFLPHTFIHSITHTLIRCLTLLLIPSLSYQYAYPIHTHTHTPLPSLLHKLYSYDNNNRTAMLKPISIGDTSKHH